MEIFDQQEKKTTSKSNSLKPAECFHEVFFFYAFRWQNGSLVAFMSLGIFSGVCLANM